MPQSPAQYSSIFTQREDAEKIISQFFDLVGVPIPDTALSLIISHLRDHWIPWLAGDNKDALLKLFIAFDGQALYRWTIRLVGHTHAFSFGHFMIVGDRRLLNLLRPPPSPYIPEVSANGLAEVVR